LYQQVEADAYADLLDALEEDWYSRVAAVLVDYGDRRIGRFRRTGLFGKPD